MKKTKDLLTVAIVLALIISFSVPQVEALTFSNNDLFNFPKYLKPKPSKTPKPTKTPKPSPTPKSGYVKVLYPNGGETFTYSDTVKVKWERNKINSCFLGFSFGEGSLNWIETNITSEMSSYDWTIDDWNMGFEPAKMKLELDCWSEDGQPMDQSDDFFTVNPLPTPTPTPDLLPSPTPESPSPVLIYSPIPYPSFSGGFFGGVSVWGFSTSSYSN